MAGRFAALFCRLELENTSDSGNRGSVFCGKDSRCLSMEENSPCDFRLAMLQLSVVCVVA